MNPFRSEAAAFRFLLASIAYFGVISVAALVGGRWVGLAAFAVASVAAAIWIIRSRERVTPTRTPFVHVGGENERRILVVANETVGGRVLRQEIESRAEGHREHVLVVCPALNTKLKHWASDEDAARMQARERLEDCLARLAEAGVEARGEIGDSDPLQAIEDAVRSFNPDEIVISTHPEGRSNWLERGVVERARERYEAPITHVVVDLEAERDEVPRARPVGSDVSSAPEAAEQERSRAPRS